MSFAMYKRLVAYARPYWLRLVIGIIAGFFTGGSLFGVLAMLPKLVTLFEKGTVTMPNLPGPLQPLADKVQSIDFSRFAGGGAEGQGESWGAVVVVILIFVVSFFLRAVFTFINRYNMRWVGGRVIMDIRNDLFNSICHQSLGFFNKYSVGHLISRTSNDTGAVESVIATSIADISRAPMEIAAVLIFVIYYAYSSGMMILPILGALVLPIGILPIVFFGRKVRIFARRSLERISELISRMTETFSGIQVVKAFHTEELEHQRFKKLNQQYFQQVINAMRAELMMNPAMELASVVLVSFFILYCKFKGIPLSQVATLFIPFLFAYEPLKRLTKMNTQIQQSMASGERIFELLDTKTALPEKPDAVPFDGFTDTIRFDNVSFGYDPERAPTVRDISFEMPQGKMVAFVGETGSGKSTLANLLARFYDPAAGSITVDGTDLRDFKIESLRRNIGIVTQRTFLFQDSIAANIAYGLEGKTREDVIHVAKQAKAHDFIMAKEGGYDAQLSEKAGNLSGGEQQRLAIARALLRDPRILILDEATSSLDTVTEQLVREALHELVKDRTTFAIAHRLSTIRHAWRIFVVEKGRIIEQGTHDELLAAGGKYTELCESAFEDDAMMRASAPMLSAPFATPTPPTDDLPSGK